VTGRAAKRERVGSCRSRYFTARGMYCAGSRAELCVYRRRRSHESLGVRTPQKFGCVVFYGSDTHENFTEINLMSAKLTTGAALEAYIHVSLTVLNRQIAGASSRTHWGSLQRSPDPLASRKGNIPSQEPHTYRPFELRCSALWAWPFPWTSTVLHV